MIWFVIAQFWIQFNPVMPSALFYLNSLDKSISYIRDVWLVFIIFQCSNYIEYGIKLKRSLQGENDHRKYFMINLHERMLPTSAAVEPRPPGLQSDVHPIEPPRPAGQGLS